MIQIDVTDSKELQATLLAIKAAPKEIRSQIRKQTKRVADIEWKKGLASRAKTALDNKALVSTAVTSVSDRQVRLKSGTKGKLKSGLPIPEIARQDEFGVFREEVKSYSGRSKKGKPYKINKRHVQRQLPWFEPKGRVVYPTVDNLVPRFAALWAQTTVRTFYEALNKK